MFTDVARLVLGIMGFIIIGMIIFTTGNIIYNAYSKIRTDVALMRNRVANLEMYLKDKADK